jgi:hypothetical protein
VSIKTNIRSYWHTFQPCLSLWVHEHAKWFGPHCITSFPQHEAFSLSTELLHLIPLPKYHPSTRFVWHRLWYELNKIANYLTLWSWSPL